MAGIVCRHLRERIAADQPPHLGGAAQHGFGMEAEAIDDAGLDGGGDLGALALGGEDDIAALQMGARIGKAEIGEQVAQSGHLDAAPADIDGAQQGDIGGHARHDKQTIRAKGGTSAARFLIAGRSRKDVAAQERQHRVVARRLAADATARPATAAERAGPVGANKNSTRWRLKSRYTRSCSCFALAQATDFGLSRSSGDR